MKFDDVADSILKEDNARRSAAGLDMDGAIAADKGHFVPWDPMESIAEVAHEIHGRLIEAQDDELTPAQCEKAADIIIGGPNEWEQQDYVRMLKGLSFVLQKMCIRPMN